MVNATHGSNLKYLLALDSAPIISGIKKAPQGAFFIGVQISDLMRQRCQYPFVNVQTVHQMLCVLLQHVLNCQL